jgi:hypothetical protein
MVIAVTVSSHDEHSLSMFASFPYVVAYNLLMFLREHMSFNLTFSVDDHHCFSSTIVLPCTTHVALVMQPVFVQVIRHISSQLKDIVLIWAIHFFGRWLHTHSHGAIYFWDELTYDWYFVHSHMTTLFSKTFRHRHHYICTCNVRTY